MTTERHIALELVAALADRFGPASKVAKELPGWIEYLTDVECPERPRTRPGAAWWGRVRGLLDDLRAANDAREDNLVRINAIAHRGALRSVRNGSADPRVLRQLSQLRHVRACRRPRPADAGRDPAVPDRPVRGCRLDGGSGGASAGCAAAGLGAPAGRRAQLGASGHPLQGLGSVIGFAAGAGGALGFRRFRQASSTFRWAARCLLAGQRRGVAGNDRQASGSQSDADHPAICPPYGLAPACRGGRGGQRLPAEAPAGP